MTFAKSMGMIVLQQGGSILGFLCFAYASDRIGRKPAFLLFLATGALAVCLLVFSFDVRIIWAASFLVGFGMSGVFGGIGPWTAELVPNTSARALAMGIAYNGGRMGALLAPVLIGWLAVDAAGFDRGFMTTFVAFLCASIIMTISVETRGRELT
jgi:MFS family permease